MGTSSTFANQQLLLFFNGTTIANLANNASSSPLTNLYASLHTADPTAAGNEASNEVIYTGYARVAVARTSGGWTVTANAVSPAATISFPACTGGTATATYWAAGYAASGATEIMYSGAISPAIAISNGVTPQLTTASTITIT